VRGGRIDLLEGPLKLSKTAVSYRRPPPRLGEHSSEVLAELTQPTSDPA
jgi:crotonobetainyl-CoA:carnitine CoA-transferase CaiB-like acyl-CoA transferase